MDIETELESFIDFEIKDLISYIDWYEVDKSVKTIKFNSWKDVEEFQSNVEHGIEETARDDLSEFTWRFSDNDIHTWLLINRTESWIAAELDDNFNSYKDVMYNALTDPEYYTCDPALHRILRGYSDHLVDKSGLKSRFY